MFNDFVLLRVCAVFGDFKASFLPHSHSRSMPRGCPVFRVPDFFHAPGIVLSPAAFKKENPHPVM
jgi:hypothetical protein